MNKDQLAVRLRALFLSELEEQLRTLNSALLALEENPKSAPDLGSLFRVVHTLKGAAQAAHVPQAESVCHALESILSQARDGKLVLESEHFSMLFGAADALADAGERLRDGRDLKDSPIAQLEQSLRSSRALPGRPSHVPARTPAPTPPAPTSAAPAPPAPTSPAPTRGAVEPEAPAPPAPAASPHSPAPPARPRQEQVRIEAEKLDAILAAAGQLSTAAGRVTARRAELDELHDLAARSCATWKRTARRVRQLAADAQAPASLMQVLDEMERNLERLGQETGQLARIVRQDARVLSQTARDVGERVHDLRLRPFADACIALPRAVRDLAAATGKEVRLEVRGGEVEADRAVLHVLHEVLLHLVRNAVDHGIEPLEARERAGKPRTGTVTIAAALQGNHLVITVSDDGRGLDLNAARAQLERQGRAVSGQEQEIVDALFEPGFSTRTDVTPVSGRGVGLDVVRTTIERIRGSVRVSSRPGEGTTFTLECPPSLATLRAVLVALGTQVLAIPSAHVEHLDRVRPEDVRRAEGRDVLLTADAPIPLVSLSRLLGPPLPDPAFTGPFPVVRLQVGERRLAVAVDELLAEQEVIVRPLQGIRNPPASLSGAALLGTGRIAIVLNSAALVAEGLGSSAPGLVFGDAMPEAAKRRRILVVDDSITTRTLEQSVLEAAGYEVLTAVDGADAWRLIQDRGCDLVVSDVEMPRMDGFQLCEAIRSSQSVAGLPVVLVTSLETPEHRARGLEAGADAYLTKSSFDQQDLLDTIRQLIG